MLAVSLFVSVTAHAQTNENQFVTVRFPRGITMDAPRSWRAVSADENEVILTTVQAALDLTGVKPTEKQSVTLFKAHPKIQQLYAYVKLSEKFGEFKDQKATQNASVAELKEFDEAQLADIKKMSEITGMKMVEWKGSRKEKTNGKWALVTEYRREDRDGPGPVWCQINAIPLRDRCVTLTLSYREREELVLKPVVLRLRSSLKIE
jgi:hypothetical protein